MDGKSGSMDDGGAALRGRVVVNAAESMVGALVGEALRARGLDVVMATEFDASLPSGSMAVAIPPSSVGEFHSDGWSTRLRSVPLEVPLVIIGRPTLPIHSVVANRQGDGGLALLDSRTLDDVDSLRSVIGLVADGMRIIDPGFVDPMLASTTLISDVERSVLELVVNGYSNRAIAEELFLSERTIETHVRNLMRRFGIAGSPDLNRRVVLARIVLDRGGPPSRGAVA